MYDEDYFAGAPAAAVHPCGDGRAYYLASRFTQDFYSALYAGLAREAGLPPASPLPLPAGVLAARRDGLLFVQNCNPCPEKALDAVLPAYGNGGLAAGRQPADQAAVTDYSENERLSLCRCTEKGALFLSK